MNRWWTVVALVSSQAVMNGCSDQRVKQSEEKRPEERRPEEQQSEEQRPEEDRPEERRPENHPSHKVKADDFAREFEEDATAAKMKYASMFSSATRGSAAIDIHGPITVMEGQQVYFKTEGEYKILLSGAMPPKDGTGEGVLKSAKYVSFFKNTIIVKGDVTYRQNVGDK